MNPSPAQPTTRLFGARRRIQFVVVVAILTSVVVHGQRANASSQVPRNPPANIAATPPLLSSGTCTRVGALYSCANPCVSNHMTWPVFTTNPECTNYTAVAINNARAREGVRPMMLPTNWNSLSVPEQLFVVANLERVDRGYPPYLGLNEALSAEAQRAVRAGIDPGVARGFTVATNPSGASALDGVWAGGGYDVLFASYFWMYADSWGGTTATTVNIACTAAGVAACWGHRDELLGSDPALNATVGLQCTTCEMGAADAVVNGSESYTDLIERPAGPPPAMTFTWTQELPFFTGATVPTITRHRAVAITVPLTRQPSLSALAVTSTRLRVRWHAAGVNGVSRVILTTYRDHGCAARTRFRTSTFGVNSHRNAHGGTINVTGTNLLAHSHTYWAIVTVHANGHAMASPCTPLRAP